jgi:signal transduction histidine kinase
MNPRLRLSRFFVWNFILLEILIVGGGGTVAYRLGRTNLIAVAEQNGIAVANHLAWVVDQFYMRPWELTFETFPYDNPIAYQELAGIVHTFISGFRVERVNIFNRRYRVIFSTDSTLLGHEEADNSKLLSALAGHATSALKTREMTSTEPDAKRTKDYLQIYTPVEVRGQTDSTARTAFEIYLDVTATYAQVRVLRRVIIACMTGVGLALLIVVLIISRRAERLVTAENRQRVALAEQIRQQNEQLETIVAQRTQQLRAAQAELVQMEKMAATGQLAAGVAHEINNPVSIIQNRIEVLLEDLRAVRPIPDLEAHLSLLHRHTERIAGIVGRLLSFARKSSTGKGPLKLDSVLSGVLVLVQKEIEKRGIALKTDIPATLPAVKGNATELEQVFINLLVNSMDATPAGGEIRFGATHTDGAVRIEVADTGSGIAPENMKAIFDPFFTTKDPGVGTGLGLAISYRIVEDHGGRIEVASAVGRGTTFTITLPALPEGAVAA